MRAAENSPVFVASELKGRKVHPVDPFRDCRVSAYGLFDPEWLERAI